MSVQLLMMIPLRRSLCSCLVLLLLSLSFHPGSAWHHHQPIQSLASRIPQRDPAIGSSTSCQSSCFPHSDGESSLISRRKLVWTSVVQVGTSVTTGVVASTILFSQPDRAVAAYIDPAISPPTITDKVYLDVEFVSNDSIKKNGRIVLGLYGQTMPKTVQNFVTLCSTNAYAGTTFYRIISEYSIQGGAIGDVTRSGKSGQSSLENGSPFEPDNFNIKHNTKGLVSMVKAQQSGSGVDSRFFIQLQDDAGWADDRYAAFGIVLEGMVTVDAIKTVAVQPPKNNPKQDVIIVESGLL